MKKRIHKKPPRRIKSKKKSYQKFITILATVVVTIFLATLIGAYIFFEKQEIIVDIEKQTQVEKKENNKLITFEEKTKALEIEYNNNIDNTTYLEKPSQKEQPVFHYEEPNYGEVGDIQRHKTTENIPQTIDKPETITDSKEEVKKENKPKLAIIIDDVTTKRQINKIKNIGYIVNMAFLPPTSGHPSSANIVKSLDSYMIHLPLQASSFKYEEEKTLYITDSLETISKRIEEIKAYYPEATFLNNHTGSKFTANKEAMDKLFQVLKKYNYTFVDSRTTAKSVAKEVAKKYGIRVLSRNIFLDNNKNKQYIQGQLKKAVKIAKKYGSAIAIGHPYSITLETLKDSKDLLEGLDLVYIEQM